VFVFNATMGLKKHNNIAKKSEEQTADKDVSSMQEGGKQFPRDLDRSSLACILL